MCQGSRYEEGLTLYLISTDLPLKVKGQVVYSPNLYNEGRCVFFRLVRPLVFEKNLGSLLPSTSRMMTKVLTSLSDRLSLLVSNDLVFEYLSLGVPFVIFILSDLTLPT